MSNPAPKIHHPPRDAHPHHKRKGRNRHHEKPECCKPGEAVIVSAEEWEQMKPAHEFFEEMRAKILEDEKQARRRAIRMSISAFVILVCVGYLLARYL